MPSVQIFYYKKNMKLKPWQPEFYRTYLPPGTPKYLDKNNAKKVLDLQTAGKRRDFDGLDPVVERGPSHYDQHLYSFPVLKQRAKEIHGGPTQSWACVLEHLAKREERAKRRRENKERRNRSPPPPKSSKLKPTSKRVPDSPDVSSDSDPDTTAESGSESEPEDAIPYPSPKSTPRKNANSGSSTIKSPPTRRDSPQTKTSAVSTPIVPNKKRTRSPSLEILDRPFGLPSPPSSPAANRKKARLADSTFIHENGLTKQEIRQKNLQQWNGTMGLREIIEID